MAGGGGIRGGGIRGEGSVWVVMVDVNEELKFLGQFPQKMSRGGGSLTEGVRWGGGGGSGWM